VGGGKPRLYGFREVLAASRPAKPRAFTSRECSRLTPNLRRLALGELGGPWRSLRLNPRPREPTPLSSRPRASPSEAPISHAPDPTTRPRPMPLWSTPHTRETPSVTSVALRALCESKNHHQPPQTDQPFAPPTRAPPSPHTKEARPPSDRAPKKSNQPLSTRARAQPSAAAPASWPGSTSARPSEPT